MVELTHSFRISSLTSLDRLRLDAADYWGINASKYEFYYLAYAKPTEPGARGEWVLTSLSEYKDLTVDKCIGKVNMRIAVLFLMRLDSNLLNANRQEKKDKKDKKSPEKVNSNALHKEDLLEREKTLCMYHGLNFLHQSYDDREIFEYSKGWHTHLATLIFTAILLIVSAVTLAGRRDVTKMFWLTNMSEAWMRQHMWYIHADDVKTSYEFQKFLELTFTDNIFGNDQFRQYNYINIMQLRGLRTKSYQCKVNNSMPCYYSSYNTKTAGNFLYRKYNRYKRFTYSRYYRNMAIFIKRIQ